MIHFPRWKTALILAVCLFALLFAVPNFLPRATVEALPSWVPAKTVNLGLDLRGGAHLLYEADVELVIEERLSGILDTVRGDLRPARIGYTGLSATRDTVSFTLTDPAAEEQALELVQRIVNEYNQASAGLSGGFGLTQDLLLRNEGPNFTITMTEGALANVATDAIAQSIEILRRRIDPDGTKEPTIQRQGFDRILIQVPGEEDTERLKRLIGTTAKMTFRFVDESTPLSEALAGRVPPGSELLPSSEVGGSGQALTAYVVRKRIMVSGESLIDAQPTFQQGAPVVSFRFDSIGARKFGDATRDNVGRLFAIVLDDEIISAPVIREPILGGNGVISGNFTVQSANDLALLLRAGALPAPLVVLEERSVGASLGQDAIEAGEFAAVVGLILVIIFMFLTYGRFGAYANIALTLNLLLLLSILSLFQATLTLPGIAGIVLTLGMAVDANVLVFERIREETRNGRTPISAVETGYRSALSTIVDANLTTLIAAIVLWVFGTGPVRGFAVTLAFGIATSMFSALMITRLLIATWIRRSRPKELPA